MALGIAFGLTARLDLVLTFPPKHVLTLSLASYICTHVDFYQPSRHHDSRVPNPRAKQQAGAWGSHCTNLAGRKRLLSES